MKTLRNERGIALMMALILTLVSLAVILAVLYLITQSIQLSASSRRYKSALEASYGGVEAFTREIIPWYIDAVAQNTVESRLQLQTNLGNLTPAFPAGAPSFASYTCMSKKLTLASSQWGTACGANATTIDPTQSPDAVFKLKGPPLQPNFNVYAKIVASQPGNSDMSGLSDSLSSGNGVAYGAAGVSPMHIPATYRIQALAQRETNPQEKAKLSVLYAY